MSGKSFRIGSERSDLNSMVDPTSATLEVEYYGAFSLDRVTTIGRAPESKIALKLPSISRHHARIFFEGGHFWIKDLDSANGTTVNGKKTKLQMLSDEDKIVFGEIKAVFRTSTKSRGPAPLAQDPMEGAEQPFQDGTPTSGLIFPPRHSRRKTQEIGKSPDKPGVDTTASTLGPEEELGGVASKRIVPDRENSQSPQIPADRLDASQAAVNLQEENARLKRLVAQLERALADSNLRLRNLQKQLDRGK